MSEQRLRSRLARLIDPPRTLFRAEPIPPAPALEECTFYHSMDFGDGQQATGAWDIRGLFGQYIGDYPISRKTLIDVGTASGFLAFEAERAGATVTALEHRDVTEFQRIPFVSSSFHRDRTAWAAEVAETYRRLKNSFWYSYRQYGSRLEVIYEALSDIPYWSRRFDVVIAGAIIEHLSDPVAAIGNLAMLAKEAVIIAFTPIDTTNELLMRTANDWTDPRYDYTFWVLSRGLYERLFDNLGFDVEFKVARARTAGEFHMRHTIIARRRTCLDSIPISAGSNI